MVTINRQSIEQLPDPSARLTLSVENLTFIGLLQNLKVSCQKVVLQLVTTIRATQIVPIWPIQPSAMIRIFALQSLI